MGKLLKFETRKLIRTKSLYVVSLISIAFVMVIALTVVVSNRMLESEGLPTTPLSAYGFTKAALGNSFSIFLAIFIPLFACEDRSSGVLKNVFAKGYSRAQVFVSKYIVTFIGVLFMSLTTVAAAYIYSYITWGNSLPIEDNVALIIFGQFVGLLAYHSLFFAISYSLGKSGVGIALCIVVPTAASLVAALGDVALKNTDITISKYWLDNTFVNFTGSVTDNKELYISLLALAAYIFVSLVMGFAVNSKKEV